MHFKKSMVVALISASGTLNAIADTFSTRNAAMGNAGVASSEYHGAAAYNPALLARTEVEDDFALTFPNFALEASDREETFDLIDIIDNDYNAFERALENDDSRRASELRDELVANLTQVSGKPVRADIDLASSIVIPLQPMTLGLELRSDADLVVRAEYDPADEALLTAAINDPALDFEPSLGSHTVASGAVVTEVAFSFAKAITVSDRPLYLGISPKIQHVETILYVARAYDYESDDVDADENIRADSAFNLDLGAAWSPREDLMLGLAIRDLIPADYATVKAERSGESDVFAVRPSATFGAAYEFGYFQVTAEADLLERSGFESAGGSQFASIGMELDAWGWAQLRAGYRADLREEASDVITAGLALVPFKVVHFGVSAAMGDDNAYGVATELKMTF